MSEVRRDGLPAGLAADRALRRAVAEGGHGHLAERALNAGMTLLCVLTGCPFPGPPDYPAAVPVKRRCRGGPVSGGEGHR